MLGPVALFEDFQDNPNGISQYIITSKASKELQIPEGLLLWSSCRIIYKGRKDSSSKDFLHQHLQPSLSLSLTQSNTKTLPRNQSKKQPSTCPGHTSQPSTEDSRKTELQTRGSELANSPTEKLILMKLARREEVPVSPLAEPRLVEGITSRPSMEERRRMVAWMGELSSKVVFCRWHLLFPSG